MRQSNQSKAAIQRKSDGKTWVLVSAIDTHALCRGDTVLSPHGHRETLLGGRAPLRAGHDGTVRVTCGTFPASVFGLAWIARQ